MVGDLSCGSSQQQRGQNVSLPTLWETGKMVVELMMNRAFGLQKTAVHLSPRSFYREKKKILERALNTVWDKGTTDEV